MAKKPTVATPSSAYCEMECRWEKVEALLGGTEEMREAGRQFLPQYSKETNKTYDTRLQRATLYNYFSKALSTLAGKPFSREIKLPDMVDQLKGLVEDIDLQGNDLSVFCRHSFMDIMAKGIGYIMVDYPDTTGVSTRADEMAMAPRPYFIYIPPENVIAAYSEQDSRGRETLTHVRVAYEEVTREGWGEVSTNYVKVFEPGKWTLYKEIKKDQWAAVRSGTMALNEIPIVTIYAIREEKGVGKSPLLDVADKNIEHWQSSSDQRHVLTVARFPMLGASGITEAEAAKVALGPTEFLALENPQGKFYYVEHTGTAIQAGAQDLANIEAQMATLAMDMLVKRPGRLTATEKSLDNNESNCVLEMLALAFEDGLERAFQYAAQWMGLDPATSVGTVKLATDYGITGIEAPELLALNTAVAAGDITLEMYLTELQRRGVIGDWADLKALLPQIQQAKADMAAKALAMAQAAKPAPAGPPVAP